MNVGIIGCGLIGTKRAKALKGQRISIVADIDLKRAQALAETTGAKATSNFENVVQANDVNAVIIATPHDQLAPLSLACIQKGKHVLVEKPAARSSEELEAVLQAAEEKRVTVKVGFNHRFHPAIQKAKEIAEGSEIGRLLYVRARYGHGGRLGYEKEWRAKRDISGGGELMDQGVHLIDLSRWFLGEFESVQGITPTYFWKMKVEDNAFMMLKTHAGQVAWLHASWTEWKNMFCFEIFGEKGKLQIDGLGRSYGRERLTFYKMKPELGPPEIQSWEFPEEDTSWERELNHFFKPNVAPSPITF